MGYAKICEKKMLISKGINAKNFKLGGGVQFFLIKPNRIYKLDYLSPYQFHSAPKTKLITLIFNLTGLNFSKPDTFQET